MLNVSIGLLKYVDHDETRWDRLEEGLWLTHVPIELPLFGKPSHGGLHSSLITLAALI